MLTVVILAAGKGTRMGNSNVPKVCRKIGDKTMIEMVVKTARELDPENICIIVSVENKEYIQNCLKNIEGLIFIEQKIINGTATAVLSASHIYKNTDILVLLGDVPLIKSSTLEKCITSDCCILGFQDFEENRFGRIILDKERKASEEGEKGEEVKSVLKIVEYAEASGEERKITSVNSGMLYLQKNFTKYLFDIDNNNSKREYYLTDIVKILKNNNIEVSYVEASKEECLGVNTPEELLKVSSII